MKSVFDAGTRQELIERIGKLQENCVPAWGKMSVYQMAKHCRLWEEMIHGKQRYKRVLLGRIFGRVALKSVLKDDAPLGHNSPSIPELIITDAGSLAAEQAAWISEIRQYSAYSNPDIIHPFFGKMTTEQVGRFVYKHDDHHLRQFGV